MSNKFLYFAYGSNLLAQRIHINNSTAVRFGIGKLNGFRLDFNKKSRYWDGGIATIVEDSNEHVWGAVWQLNTSDMDHLDKQEKNYLAFDASVVTPNGETLVCRSYMLHDQPTKEVPIPPERCPSKAYIKTILLGAHESGLPVDYITYLHGIPNNGKEGPAMPWSSHSVPQISS